MRQETLKGWSVGESKLTKMTCSGLLAPHFVNNDHITAEIIYSNGHARQEVLT